MPQSAPELVVVGELNVDLLLEEVNALPSLETERRAEGMSFVLGSSSAILAANASALGVDVGFVGRVGDDLFGRFCTNVLEQRGVGIEPVKVGADVQTGLTAIYTHGGERGMITYPGAMEHLTLEDIPWDYLRDARHVHVSSYYLQRGLQSGCARLFKNARAMGLSTSFDTNADPNEEWNSGVLDVLEQVDVFLPNDVEARRISGEKNLETALEVLADRAGIVVATCGAEGAVAYTGDRFIRQPAVPVEPVDAIGAGDSFNAGFLQKHLQGVALEKCIQQGLRAGAFSTCAAGGTAAFEDPEAFERFASQSA